MANYIPEFGCYYCLLEWERPKYILIQNANDIFSNAVRPRMPHFQWMLSCNYLSVFLDIRGTARLRDQSGHTVKMKELNQYNIPSSISIDEKILKLCKWIKTGYFHSWSRCEYFTVDTVTRRRNVVSTREHFEIGWHWRIDWPRIIVLRVVITINTIMIMITIITEVNINFNMITITTIINIIMTMIKSLYGYKNCWSGKVNSCLVEKQSIAPTERESLFMWN